MFSDLDGTLLDHDTYDWRAAAPALALLRTRQIPLVLVSSKTLSELQDYRQQLQLRHPVVAENGAAIDIPNGYFDESLGINAPTVGRQLLQQAYLGAKAELGLDACAFFELGTEGIMDATGLDADQALRANERLASEPILWRDSEGKLEKFSEAMREKGLQCVRGGRFVHLMPDTNKAEAMLSLVKAYGKHWSGNNITSVALGDGPNDIRMLEAADIAVVIPGKHEHDMTLKENNRVLYPSAHGPDGWNEAMLSLLQSDEPESLHNPEI